MKTPTFAAVAERPRAPQERPRAPQSTPGATWIPAGAPQNTPQGAQEGAQREEGRSMFITTIGRKKHKTGPKTDFAYKTNEIIKAFGQHLTIN